MKDRLYRSRKFRVLGGVAGGLAEYFSLDPILMRVIFVVIAIMTGIGILLYIILWIVIPEEPFELAYNIKTDDVSSSQTNSEETTGNANLNIPTYVKKSGPGRIIAGIILIAIGMLFLADRFIPSFCFEDVLPVSLILIGIVLIWNAVKK